MEQRRPPMGYGTKGGMKELALHGWRPERGVQHSLSAQFWARGGIFWQLRRMAEERWESLPML